MDCIFKHQAISIHAPTRGATLDYRWMVTYALNFNPRSHKGSDLMSKMQMSALFYFNPRSHKGSDSNISQKNLFIQ